MALASTLQTLEKLITRSPTHAKVFRWALIISFPFTQSMVISYPRYRKTNGPDRNSRGHRYLEHKPRRILHLRALPK